jgi:hypothetical protein
MHYQRWKLHGDAAWSPPTLADRLWARVDKAGPTSDLRPDLGPCWLWQGPRLPNGYGVASHKNRNRYTHRVSYELVVGPIPDGLQIDHLCMVRACCNPDHLEPVTAAENTRRAVAARGGAH